MFQESNRSIKKKKDAAISIASKQAGNYYNIKKEIGWV
jgi:hypothetical protein